MTRSISIRLFN